MKYPSRSGIRIANSIANSIAQSHDYFQYPNLILGRDISYPSSLPACDQQISPASIRYCVLDSDSQNVEAEDALILNVPGHLENHADADVF